MKKLLMLSILTTLSFANGSIGVNSENSNINAMNGKENISVIIGNYLKNKNVKDVEKILKELETNEEVGDANLDEKNENVYLQNKTNKKINIKKSASNDNGSFLISNLLKYAKSYLGVKYLWGGITKSGLDCSGFTLNVFRELGIEIPRVSRDQHANSRKISEKDAKVGDLVFFKTTNKNVISHVGIYLGNNRFIHASSKGKKVQINELKGYYREKLSGFGTYLY